MPYQGQQGLVLGLGDSGLAMARWCVRAGASVRVADTRPTPPQLAALNLACPDVAFIAGAFDVALLEGVDFIAVSPGLSPRKELAVLLPAAAEKGIPVWGEIELFAQALASLKQEQQYTPKVIAITGTNGKTTVTNLCAQMIKRSGLRVQMAGNISPAALDVLMEALDAEALPQVWVLELSSFQLHTTTSLQADVATVLNISEDHLDWHGDMASYIQDKARIFSANTIQVLNRDDAKVMQMALPLTVNFSFGSDVPDEANSFGLLNKNGMLWLAHAVEDETDEKPSRRKNIQLVKTPVSVSMLMPADALKIRGLHNAVNALAAMALCRAIDLPLAPLLHGLRDYQGEPHRVELIATIADVAYYDDSKGTNVGATVAALKGLGAQQKLLLIAGGDGKGQDFSPLAEPVAKHVRAVFLIGRDAAAIRSALASTGIDLIDCASLEQAVQQAAAMAQAGQAVLLSPACASLDMFKNYAQRAAVFGDAVREIALTRGELA